MVIMRLQIIKANKLKTTVVNLRKSEYDVYIGRAGHGQDGYFGNPFPLENDDREACLEKYKQHFYKRIETDPEFLLRINELKGKRLGCFCYPKMCHGMIIVEYLEGISVREQMTLAIFDKLNLVAKPIPPKETTDLIDFN